MEDSNIAANNELRLNEEITGREVRLIDQDGEQMGVVSLIQARRLAEEQGRAQVNALNVPGPEGRPLSLGTVATLREGNMPSQIVRAEKRRVVKLSSDLSPGSGLGTAGQAIHQAIDELLPAGYQINFINIFEKMVEAIDEFKLITFVAILLTYLLLAALLESWTQPFLILTTVPFAYLGLFAALAMTYIFL